MRFVSAAALAVLAALANGCTVHVGSQPASAPVWSAAPTSPVVVVPAAPYVTEPRPTAEPRPATPQAAPPRRQVASRERPSAYQPVRARPSSKPAPVARPEPRPTQPSTGTPVVVRPAPNRPEQPAAEVPKGRYPFRLTRPEPRRNEPRIPRANRTTVDRMADERRRPPFASNR
jgi:hypothetical protein